MQVAETPPNKSGIILQFLLSLLGPLSWTVDGQTLSLRLDRQAVERGFNRDLYHPQSCPKTVQKNPRPPDGGKTAKWWEAFKKRVGEYGIRIDRKSTDTVILLNYEFPVGQTPSLEAFPYIQKRSKPKARRAQVSDPRSDALTFVPTALPAVTRATYPRQPPETNVRTGITPFRPNNPSLFGGFEELSSPAPWMGQQLVPSAPRFVFQHVPLEPNPMPTFEISFEPLVVEPTPALSECSVQASSVGCGSEAQLDGVQPSQFLNRLGWHQ